VGAERNACAHLRKEGEGRTMARSKFDRRGGGAQMTASKDIRVVSAAARRPRS